ncbi:multicopper oxidase domain-containing protein [Phycicoccus sonneratiae]|uniref:Multicopper oxidase domain-containing protein n=1 Tax=Phycicoccus sonneratiae TaxID=2807628 RepID=A0ABS2CLR6_9MICO|nr:multicopper oxidase domain-containing protein [Phycicoccus sonneraticus]MBM6400014.1 multicopper oxidase domain-containing protein [Phycicoccus sonneraticus]
MSTRFLTRRALRRGAVVAVGALVALGGAAATSVPAATAAAPPRNGIVCTTGGTEAGHPVFDLTTRTGYIDLPDGNTAFMWGFSNGFDAFQHPGPVLCVTEGDEVTVILHNTLDVATSIVFPGQEGVRADGVPSQPQVDAGSGMMTGLGQGAAPSTGTVSYTFTATHAGTFLYESGTDPETQVRMGLFGALIVRPAGHADQAYDAASSRFTASEEVMVLLSEIDPFQHAAVEQGKTFNLVNYKARYWLVNGRGYPDSIADNGASWLPSQPYGSLATVKPYDPATHPLPGLARYLSVGSEDYPFHPHGNNGLVVGRDGHPLTSETGQDLSMEKFAINIGPGQTWDVLYKWYDAEDYSPSNPVSVTVPSLANQVVGTFYSGSPYLGDTKELPPGVQTLNQCGEFYIISHNHALFQITSWGVNMTGPITYMRIEPPEPNTCA